YYHTRLTSDLALRRLIHDGGRGYVLQCHPGAVKDERFIRRRAAGALATNDLPKLSVDLVGGERASGDGVVQVAERCALCCYVSDDVCAGHQGRFEFLLVFIVRTDSGDEAAGCNMLGGEKGAARGSAGDNDLGGGGRLRDRRCCDDREAELGTELVGECGCGGGNHVVGGDFAKLTDMHERPQLCAALHPASDDGRARGPVRRQVFRGYRSGGGGAQHRDL